MITRIPNIRLVDTAAGIHATTDVRAVELRTVSLDDLNGNSKNSPFLACTFEGQVLRTWLREEQRYAFDTSGVHHD
jgi:dihydroorotase-like cyclic amidohydrolase